MFSLLHPIHGVDDNKKEMLGGQMQQQEIQGQHSKSISETNYSA